MLAALRSDIKLRSLRMEIGKMIPQRQPSKRAGHHQTDSWSHWLPASSKEVRKHLVQKLPTSFDHPSW